MPKIDLERSELRTSWENQYARSKRPWRGPADHALEFSAQETVLELGCGNGKALQPVLEAGCHCVAIDHSANALRACALLRRAKGDLELVKGDIGELPFADSRFERVLGIHILEHLLLQARRQAAREIARVMAPDARLNVIVFGRNDMRYGKGEEVEKDTFRRGDGIIYHYFDEQELISLFAELAPLDVSKRTAEKRFDSVKHIREELVASFRKTPG